MKYSGHRSMLKTFLLCFIALMLLIHEAKSECFQGESSEVTALNSGPSSFSTNRIIATRKGSVFLINQNTLFRMQRDEGDVWDRVAEDVQTASFDPRNDKIIYRVTSQNLVTKSLDGGEKRMFAPWGGQYMYEVKDDRARVWVVSPFSDKFIGSQSPNKK